MNRIRDLIRQCRPWLPPLLLLGVVGCYRPLTSEVRIVSFRAAGEPQSLVTRFDECVYRAGPLGDEHIVAKGKSSPGGPSGHSVTEYLHVHVYWNPRPGKTFADSSQSDATLRYVVVSEEGASFYTGTGFVSLDGRRSGGALPVRLENGWLRLEQQVGQPPDVVGDAQLEGSLIARPEANRALDLQREMSLLPAFAAGG